MNTDQSSAIEIMPRAGQWGWAQAQQPLTSQSTVKEPGQEGAALQLTAPPCRPARPLTAEWLAPSRAPRGTQPLLSLWNTGALFCPYLWLCLNLGAENWEGAFIEYCHYNTEWKLWSCHGCWADNARTHTGLSETGERVSEHAHLRWARRECFLQPTCSHGQGVWPKIPEKGLENQVFTPVTHNIKINENKNPVLLVDSWIAIKTWNVSV